MDKVIPLNPSLNGGQKKTDLLPCGCDPANAELDKDGKRRVFLIKVNEGFFGPLGAPNMGMQMSLCAQCKEVMGFQVVSQSSIVLAPA